MDHDDADRCPQKVLSVRLTSEQGQVNFDKSKPLKLEDVRIVAGQGNERAAKALADVGRLSADKQQLATQAMLHRLATTNGQGCYIDPDTGFSVFTATSLKQKTCCGYSCRHCPHLGTAGCNIGKSKKSTESLATNW